MRIRTRMRPGVYWDEHNIERRCLILEMIDMHGEITVLGALDRETQRPVPDPPSAIPIDTQT